MVDIFEMERSRRRGGENRARFDFSMRHAISADATGSLGGSSCVGLKNKARFDVSRVGLFTFDPEFSLILRPLSFNEPGVLRPIHKFGENFN